MKLSTKLMVALLFAVCCFAAYATTVQPPTYFGSAGIAVDEGKLYTRNTSTKVDTAVTATADTLSNAVSSTSSGFKLVCGTTTTTGTSTVATGLTTITAATANLGQDAALTGNCVTTTATAGTLTIKVWKPTGTGDTTPIAATVAKTVLYMAWGT